MASTTVRRLVSLHLLAALFAIAFLFGCNCSTTPDRTTHSAFRIDGEQYLLNVQDFDLQQVIALIRDNKIKDAADLEKQINGKAGINNVDADRDGKVDYVKIKESRKDAAVAMEFLAVPSSTQNVDDAVTIASVDFSRSVSSKDVEIQGGYANHVNGHENTFFSSFMRGPSLTEMLFFAWLFTPSRPFYYAPMMPAYTPQPVDHRRRTAQNHSDIRRSAKPSTFDAGSRGPKRSFETIRNRSRSTAYDTREVREPRSPTSFRRPTRSPFRGFRRR